MPCSTDPLSITPLPANQTPPKFPCSFARGSVGLGIAAAMNTAAVDYKLIASRPRSEPIPIMSPWPRGEGWADAGEADEEEEELSESYTCVISHVAGSKRVYFDDGSDGLRYVYGASPGVFFQSPPAMEAAEFIKRCYICVKKLHGLEIFVYRGDKALCSLGCRSQQNSRDGYRENYTVSPTIYSAGVAAA